jgi:hypothetical protein
MIEKSMLEMCNEGASLLLDLQASVSLVPAKTVLSGRAHTHTLTHTLTHKHTHTHTHTTHTHTQTRLNIPHIVSVSFGWGRGVRVLFCMCGIKWDTVPSKEDKDGDRQN